MGSDVRLGVNTQKVAHRRAVPGRGDRQRVGADPVAGRSDHRGRRFARAVEKGMRYVVLPEALAYRRVHGANMSVRHRAHVQAEYFHILKAALDRRRAGRAEVTCSLP